MIFRDFVEQVKDATEMAAAGLHGGRDLTPFLHADTPEGVVIAALDYMAFTSRAGQIALVHEFVIPLVLERKVSKVAWSFTGDMTELPEVPQGIPFEEAMVETTHVLVATFLDAERSELWHARLRQNDSRAIVDDWRPWTPNATDGPILIQPIQEAMR